MKWGTSDEYAVKNKGNGKNDNARRFSVRTYRGHNLRLLSVTTIGISSSCEKPPNDVRFTTFVTGSGLRIFLFCGWVRYTADVLVEHELRTC